MGVACLALVLALVTLQVWDANLSVPFSYSGDALQNQLLVKTLVDHGWYQDNPDLGWPAGMDLRDFAVVSGDNLHMAGMWLIARFTDDAAAVMNVFFLATFPLTAVIAFTCIRLLGVGRAPAAAAAVLFALAPYHFLRGEHHLFIAAYYAVPLGAWLVLRILAGDGVPRGRRLVLLTIACAVIGSAHVYYAAFTVLLAAMAALAAALRPNWGAVRLAGALIALITVAVLANHAPNIVQRLDEGRNEAIARDAGESETYGLRFAQMVLPVPDHRVGPLGRLRERYTNESDAVQVQEAQPQALGLLASAGMVVCLLALITAAARGRLNHDRLLVATGTAVAFALLLGTAGGLSSLIALIATPELRAWGRISIFIAFFGLLAGAVLLERFVRSRSAVSAAIVLATIIAIGWLDQTTARFAPDHRAIAASYQADASFIRELERRLPAGAPVFALPHEPFPEPQPAFFPADLGPYDLARGYIHSSDLRWSYGAVKGRDDWQSALTGLPPGLFARGLAALGAAGIYVDRHGYADGGRRALAGLRAETGTAPLTSEDGRLAFVDIRRLRDELKSSEPEVRLRAAAEAARQPLVVSGGPGLSALRHDESGTFRFAERRAALEIVNPASAARSAVVQFGLAGGGNPPRRIRVTFPDGTESERSLGTDEVRVRRRLTLPPGRTTIRLEALGERRLLLPDVARAYYARVVDVVAVPDALLALGPLPADAGLTAHLSPFEAR